MIAWLLCILLLSSCEAGENKAEELPMSWRALNSEEERVLVHKGTEAPFSGAYEDHWEEGVYICRRCGGPLYNSSSKFNSRCGWPSFDREIPGAVIRHLDADGKRTEIVCARCGGHLGHVFEGEGFTPANTRHCVNSLSMDFIPAKDTAYFAAGCFWGVEYHLKKLPGVLETSVGYMGGTLKNPSYEQVSTGETGHLETVRVIYQSEKLSYEQLAQLFFEIHDFSQTDGQGPDLGSQYLSVIFYRSAYQRHIAQQLIDKLGAMGHKVATSLREAPAFYAAEEYHQDYYERKGSVPYCHVRRPIFGEK